MLEDRNGMLHYFSDESSAHYLTITGLMFAAWKLEFAMEDSDREVRWRPPHPNYSVQTPREKGGGGVLPENNFSRPLEVFSWPKNKEGARLLSPRFANGLVDGYCMSFECLAPDQLEPAPHRRPLGNLSLQCGLSSEKLVRLFLPVSGIGGRTPR